MVSDNLHFYEIDLTQGDLAIQLISDDPGFISDELQRWFEKLLDERYKPIAIPPGLVLMPNPPTAMPLDTQAPTEPTIQQAPATAPAYEDLMAQIQQLQAQVQQLTQQNPPAAEATIPYTTPSEESIWKTDIPDSQPDSGQSPPVASSPTTNQSYQASLDAFVEPAHPDFEGAFETFQLDKTDVHLELTGFEQAVNNISVSVENLGVTAIATHMEVAASTVLSETTLVNEHPVENRLEENTQLAEAPVSDAPAATENEEFDILMDALMTDLEKKTQAVTSSPMEAVEDETEETPPTASFKTITPSLEEIPEPTTAAEDPIDALAQDFLAASTSEESPPQLSLEEQLDKDLKPYAEVLPEAPDPALENHQLDEFFPPPTTETAEPTADETPSPDISSPEPAAEDKPVYEAPKVNYDFGIPGPDPIDDPNIRHLSLETLQENAVPLSSFESPFPKLSDEDIEEGKIPPAPTPRVSRPAPPPPAAAVPPPPEESPPAPPTTPRNIDELEVETLQELCDLAPRATNSLDFLVLAAYFLNRYQGTEKYSLKDINAQLIRAGLTPVNHGTLENAVSQNHVQLVPDLTGTAQAAEYTLTDSGKDYVKSLF